MDAQVTVIVKKKNFITLVLLSIGNTILLFSGKPI